MLSYVLHTKVVTINNLLNIILIFVDNLGTYIFGFSFYFIKMYHFIMCKISTLNYNITYFVH